MYLDDGIPIDRTHAVEDAVPQDAGVIDDAVDAAKVVDRRLDDAFGSLRIGDAVAVGDRRAAGFADLSHDLVGHAFIAAVTLRRTAQVVDDDLGTLAGGEQGNLATD